MKKLILILLLSPLLLLAQPKVILQVLGSGGPESGDMRASSGYLIWIDGKSRILIDFGGGASLRFEEVGARIQDLDLILLTHLHVLRFSNQAFSQALQASCTFLVPIKIM